MRFNIADVVNVKEFTLQEIRFDDWVIITLNNNKVYSGPYNFSKLEMGHKPLWGYHRVDIGDSRDHSTENDTWYQRSLNLNLKSYLKSGNNELKIRLIVGGKGGLFMNFKFSQYGCNKWSEYWQTSCNPDLKCPSGENILFNSCSAAGDRYRSNVKVNRLCWERQIVKTCKLPLNPRDCAYLDTQQNCIWNNTEVSQADANNRALKNRKYFGCYENKEIEQEYEETVFDPDAKDASSQAVCDALCMKGDCIDASNVENEDFGKALASLQMASEMSKDVKLQGGEFMVDIFKGEAGHCSKKAMGWTDCCGDGDGWGTSLGASCTEEESKLRKLKQDERCIFVGDECVDKQAGRCWVRKYHYCCYENRLARI